MQGGLFELPIPRFSRVMQIEDDFVAASVKHTKGLIQYTNKRPRSINKLFQKQSSCPNKKRD